MKDNNPDTVRESHMCAMNASYMFYDEDYPNDWDGIGDACIEDLTDETLEELLQEVEQEMKRRQNERHDTDDYPSQSRKETV